MGPFLFFSFFFEWKWFDLAPPSRVHGLDWFLKPCAQIFPQDVKSSPSPWPMHVMGIGHASNRNQRSSQN